MISHHEARQVVAQLKIVLERDVELLDDNGLVLASRHANRTSLYDAAGAVCQKKNKALTLSKSDLAQYPNSRPGLYFPVYYKGSLLCVVGITGQTGEVLALGGIVESYIKLLFEQNERQRLDSIREKSFRNFGRDLIGDMDPTKRELCHKNALLFDYNLTSAKIILVADFAQTYSKDSEPGVKVQEQEFHDMLYQHFLEDFADCHLFFHLGKERYALIYEIAKGSTFQPQSVHDIFTSWFNQPVRLGVGNLVIDLDNYSSSYHLANSALEIGSLLAPEKLIYSWNQYKTQILLLSDNTRFRDVILDASSDIIRYFLENRAIMDTIFTFFECGMNAAKTAAKLHYHKNTILYRLNRFISDSNINIFNPNYCSEIYYLLLLQKMRESASN